MKCITSTKVLFFIGLIIKVDIWAFRCGNGNEIPDSQFCDRQDNCGDRSDETYLHGCNRRCGRGKFMCSNKICFDITVRCNGILDCLDHSDEQNCAEQTRIEVQPENCPLEQGKYLCKNKLACLDFSLVCNGQCDCVDCSDENTENCTKLDSESCISCTQYCLPTPDGPRCICNSTNYETSPLCKEIQNCTQGSVCDQHCTRYRNFEKCLCYDGYHEVLGSNGQKCQSNLWREAILLYSTVTRIKFLDLYKKTVEIAQNEVNCIALTAAHDYMYYATYDYLRGYIIHKSQMIKDGNNEEIVEISGEVSSLSIDWVTKNVYFVMAQYLSVCTNNNRTVCIQLICCGISNVAVAPKFGKMFYMQNTKTGENDQFMMKSNMDGSEEEMLLLDESFLNPVSLTIDELTEKLYWLEVAEQKLHSVSFDGSNRQIQFLGNEGFSTFTVLENKIYFAKHRNNSFYYSDTLPHFKEHQDDATSSIRHLYLHIPNLAAQRSQQIENPCTEASCNSLCLLRPSSSGGLNYTCLCEHFYPVDHDKWCNNHLDYFDQNNEPATKTQTTLNTKLDAQSTTEDRITTNQDIIYSSSELTESTLTSNDILSSITQSETQETYSSTANTRPSENMHSSTEPNANTTLPEKPNSSTERNQTTPSNEVINSSSSHKSASMFSEDEFHYVLIYSTVTKIKALHLDTGEHQIIQDRVDSTALAATPEYIYYATVDDKEGGTIFRTSTDFANSHQSSSQIVMIDSRIMSIAVDWITNNVYFTTNVSLSVCSSEGEICTELKCCDTDAVAVAPSFRLMFYTHKMISDDKHVIMKSGMDGSGEQILLDESFNQLGSLTVDESNEMLYWLEIEEQILHNVSFSGIGKKELPLKDERHSYKYFALLEGNFFYTYKHNSFRWQSYQWSRWGRWSHIYRDGSTNSVKFLHALNISSQNSNKIENPCKFSPCTGLCLLHPGLSNFTCICDNFTPRDENRWCNKKSDFFTAPKSDVTPKNYLRTSTKISSVNFTSNQTHRLDGCSSVSIAPASIGSLQSEYLIASGVLGFIFGTSIASLIILACYIFQKWNRRWAPIRPRKIEEMEM